MSYLTDEIVEQHGDTTLIGVWSATVASDAADATTRVAVLIPAFDAQLRWGPCKWMPRVTPVTVGADHLAAPLYPKRGDSALVAYDDTGELWIVCWWPKP